MELKYLQALEEYNVSPKNLPADIKTGINLIQDILRGLATIEKKGMSPKPETMKKLIALDKWVYYDILDFVNETDNNDDNMPVDGKEVVEDIKEQIKEAEVDQKELQLGLKIESELEALHKANVESVDIDTLRSKAPVTYDVIFDNYEDGEQNGVETSKYKLIEVDKNNEIFKITKK